jgi:hypothetical protein
MGDIWSERRWRCWGVLQADWRYYRVQAGQREPSRCHPSGVSFMKTSMLIKCEKCGYENFPQHRFCGMCAAELRIPGVAGAQPAPPPTRVPAPAAPPVKQRVVTSVSGPSFLGLANEPANDRSVSYLLEDEPEPRHWGRYLGLILLVGAMVAGWYWRQDLGWLAGKFSGSAAGANVRPNSSAPDGSGSPADVAPASNASAGTQVEKPGAGDQAAAQIQTPLATAPAAASSSAADSAQASQPDQSQPSNASDTSDAKPDLPVAAARHSVTASAATGDDLEAEGEKYLYGNGVAENCGRARKSLLAAAQRSNAKAQNVLGTMYATGHCATRDLPTAYRWFGRSLRKDPSNTRIEQDLKVLWNQMTPEEQKLALRAER